MIWAAPRSATMPPRSGVIVIMPMVTVVKTINIQWAEKRRIRGAARSEPKAPVTSAQEIKPPITVAGKPISFK